MIGTVVAIVLALLTAVVNHPAPPPTTLGHPLLVIIPLTMLAIFFLFNVLALTPLQKSEQNLTPRVLDLVRKDHHLGFIRLGLFFVILFMFILSLTEAPFGSLPTTYSLPLWIISMGVSLDLLTHLFRRTTLYLNPPQMVKMFTQSAKWSVQNDKELDLCDSLDALTELAQHALDKSSFSLCNQAVTELQLITRLFLESSKSIGHTAENSESKSLGIQDKVSYTLFFLFQRLDLIFEKALKMKLEPVCSHIVTMLGKVSIDAAKLDLTLTAYPVNYIGKFAVQGESVQFWDIGLKASCTLLEVAKTIITEVDIAYSELKDPFFSIINNLDEISKAAFKRDKTINIKLLIQPFVDLQEMFKIERAANHQDAPIILKDLDRVIAEYMTLDLVMKTIPPIPSFETETPTPSTS